MQKKMLSTMKDYNHTKTVTKSWDVLQHDVRILISTYLISDICLPKNVLRVIYNLINRKLMFIIIL